MSPLIENRQPFAAVLGPLFEPKRYKVVYGGRGGLKSWGFSDALLIQGTQRFERILCARETMGLYVRIWIGAFLGLVVCRMIGLDFRK
jgi:hypothetical protein